jgi:hypothetical protein
MPLRNSSPAVEDLSDLSHLDELVVDKRYGQRSSAKKNRRNRHYEKQFIRNSLARHLQLPRADAVEESGPLTTDVNCKPEDVAASASRR